MFYNIFSAKTLSSKVAGKSFAYLMILMGIIIIIIIKNDKCNVL